MEQKLKFEFLVSTTIHKPIAAVFDAIVNHEKLNRYFTQTATGPMVTGTTVIWNFTDVPGDFPVHVRQVVPNELVAMEGDGKAHGYPTHSEMTFESLSANTTLLKITEVGWSPNQAGLDRSYQVCQGWTKMSCALKVFLEYGIDLRKKPY